MSRSENKNGPMSMTVTVYNWGEDFDTIFWPRGEIIVNNIIKVTSKNIDSLKELGIVELPAVVYQYEELIDIYQGGQVYNKLPDMSTKLLEFLKNNSS